LGQALKCDGVKPVYGVRYNTIFLTEL